MRFWDKGFFIFAQVKKGNVKAFESLFKESYQPLCKFCNDFVGNPDVAEELVQDFFYNFWKNRENITIKSSLKSYMFGSVKNLSLNYLDKARVRQVYLDRLIAQGEKDFSIQLEEQINLRDLQGQVEKVLEELPERYRKTFKMSRYDGFSNSQIAQKLSVSVKTVEADLTRTLKLLRSRLGSINTNKIDSSTNE